MIHDIVQRIYFLYENPLICRLLLVYPFKKLLALGFDADYAYFVRGIHEFSNVWILYRWKWAMRLWDRLWFVIWHFCHQIVVKVLSWNSMSAYVRVSLGQHDQTMVFFQFSSLIINLLVLKRWIVLEICKFWIHQWNLLIFLVLHRIWLGIQRIISHFWAVMSAPALLNIFILILLQRLMENLGLGQDIDFL